MADERLAEAGKVPLLNTYPISRENLALSRAKVIQVGFVSHDDAGDGGVIIGTGRVPVRPDERWNQRLPLFKALTRPEEVIRDRCDDLDAELGAIVQEVQVGVARLPVVQANQSHAHAFQRLQVVAA